jgi:hypothetical protein
MTALLFCNRVDMKIVTPRDQDEFKQYERLCVNAASVRDPVAIGALRGSDSFTWFDSFAPISYPLPWLPGEPNNKAGLEHCVFAEKANGRIRLNDAKCDGGYFQIICESDYTRGSCTQTG